MVKAFKESHENDVERLAADRRREAESEETHALANAPKPCDTVLSITGLTSLGPVWTIGIFRSGNPAVHETNQTEDDLRY